MNAFVALALVLADESFPLDCSSPCAVDAPRPLGLVSLLLHTLELIGNNHPWGEALFLQEFALKTLCCLRVPMSLQQDIQHVPFRIHRAPQIVLLSFECDYYFTLDAIYPQCKNVCAAVEERIAVRISGTIPESIRRSPRRHDTASTRSMSR